MRMYVSFDIHVDFEKESACTYHLFTAAVNSAGNKLKTENLGLMITIFIHFVNSITFPKKNLYFIEIRIEFYSLVNDHLLIK